MPVVGPLVSADVKVMGDQAFCRLINRTGALVRFRLPKATVVVPGNSEGNVVADFVDGFSVSTEEHGLLFGDDVKTTRSDQPWNVRNVMGEQAPALAQPPVVPEPEPVVEVQAPVAKVQPVVEVESIDAGVLTVAEVLEWVGTDPKRKAAALKSERKGKARKGLIASLSA